MATKKKSIGDVLKAETNWIKGYLAMTDDGGYVDPHELAATKWCLVGAAIRIHAADTPGFRAALKRIARTILKRDAWRPRAELYRGSDWDVCAVFNNHPKTTFKDIQELIEQAKV